MDDIRREDPPADSRGRPAMYADIADKLRADPGNWYRIFDFPAGEKTSFGHHVRRGRLAAFRPAGAFEAVQRFSEGRNVVYARYVGGQP